MVGIDQNLIDAVWGDERPARPANQITVQPVERAGKSFEEKVEDLRKELAAKKRSAMVICMAPDPFLIKYILTNAI